MPETVQTNEEPMILRLGGVKEDGTPDIAEKVFEFPVPHRRMTVRQKVRIDSAQGRAGAFKQALGYEDSEISVSFSLVEKDFFENGGPVSRTALEQLRAIQQEFRRTDRESSGDGPAVPQVFSIQSPLTDQLDIRCVLFADLDVGDVEGADRIDVTMDLLQFESLQSLKALAALRRQQEQAGTGTSGTQPTAQEPETEADLREQQRAEQERHEEESEWERAFRQGRSDAMGGESPESPGA